MLKVSEYLKTVSHLTRLRFRALLCAMVALTALSALLVVQGCNRPSPPQELNFETEYQAVFLDNGQVFFGKLENAGSSYPLLRDVFYVQGRVDQDTEKVTNILVKRGQEWHGPDFMYVNAEHIAVIEPVAPDSKVARLIKEANTEKTGGPE